MGSNSKVSVRIELRERKPSWEKLTDRQRELLDGLQITKVQYEAQPWRSVLATRRQARAVINAYWDQTKRHNMGGIRITLDARDIEIASSSFFHEFFLTFPSEELVLENANEDVLASWQLCWERERGE